MAKHARSLTYVVGDERPIVTGYCKEEETGLAVDLSAADSVDFFLWPRNEDGSLGTVKVDGAAGVIADAVKGKVTWAQATDDMDTAGHYIGYFLVYWGASDTVPQTFSAVEITIVEIENRMTP